MTFDELERQAIATLSNFLKSPTRNDTGVVPVDVNVALQILGHSYSQAEIRASRAEHANA